MARVQAPHAGETLTERAEEVLHFSRPDRLVAGVAGKCTHADTMGQDLEEFDFVGNVKEQWILVDGDIEGGPDYPVLAGGSTAARDISGVGRFLYKAITAEFIFDFRGQRSQDCCCGYDCYNRKRNEE
jgi:hypothetical protein